MGYLWLLVLLASTTSVDARCRAKYFKCELRCNEDTKGATMSRIRCYDRCRENEAECRKYRDDEP